VTGAPAAPIAPGERAALSARALYGDGSEQDVTAVAIWRTTDAGVATVDTTGMLATVSPGRVDVSAKYQGAEGVVTLVVAALPAAYFFGDVEYAFDCVLDALGRVASYRMARRPDVDYGSEPWQDVRVGECRGDLCGAYDCTSPAARMQGESGRLVTLGSGAFPLPTTRTYRYESARLVRVDATWRGPGSHAGGTSRSVLA
jgi:hypothetical protein